MFVQGIDHAEILLALPFHDDNAMSGGAVNPCSCISETTDYCLPSMMRSIKGLGK